MCVKHTPSHTHTHTKEKYTKLIFLLFFFVSDLSRVRAEYDRVCSTVDDKLLNKVLYSWWFCDAMFSTTCLPYTHKSIHLSLALVPEKENYFVAASGARVPYSYQRSMCAICLSVRVCVCPFSNCNRK